MLGCRRTMKILAFCETLAAFDQLVSHNVSKFEGSNTPKNLKECENLEFLGQIDPYYPPFFAKTPDQPIFAYSKLACVC